MYCYQQGGKLQVNTWRWLILLIRMVYAWNLYRLDAYLLVNVRRTAIDIASFGFSVFQHWQLERIEIFKLDRIDFKINFKKCFEIYLSIICSYDAYFAFFHANCRAYLHILSCFLKRLKPPFSGSKFPSLLHPCQKTNYYRCFDRILGCE